MKVNDYITYIETAEDVVYLKTPAFPVNMRLFKSSKGYRQIVLNCCQYIKWLALTTLEGYKKSYGMSGANAAIPFNIIGIVRNRGKKNEHCEIMINPVICATEGKVKAKSNCGSVRLAKSIDVWRAEKVLVNYYDEKGIEHLDWLEKRTGGMTAQHEIDHNLGVLITQRAVKTS